MCKRRKVPILVSIVIRDVNRTDDEGVALMQTDMAEAVENDTTRARD